MGFLEKLSARRQATGGILCVGLDPDLEKLPESVRQSSQPLYEFCRAIVASTKEYAAAFKPNLGFFEAQGSDGIAELEQLLAEIPEEIPVILDAKRGDIGNTAEHYARFLFEHLDGDATTVSPYMGRDALDPFFGYPGKIPFVLCLTSNPGSIDIQTAPVGEGRVYHRVIDLLHKLDNPFGLVVGARHETLLKEIRSLAPDAPLLIPGIGAQGGDLAAVVTAGTADNGLAVVNVSRDILYASQGEDFAEAAAKRAASYVAEMKEILTPAPASNPE
jgi:orotidine-5'-phosphate decarboxylase